MMKHRVIISAGTHKAKCYPYWNELVLLLSEHYRCIQVGIGAYERIPGCEYVWDKPLKEVEDLALDVGYFIAIDNFLHHMAYQFKIPGVVIWGPSDPLIFGYESQGNIIKDRKYLRKDQFGFYRDYIWEHDKDGWYSAEEVYGRI